MATTNTHPATPALLTFTPLYRTVRWGGNRLEKFKGSLHPLPPDTGESWELSGLETPDATLVATGPYQGFTLPQLLELHGPSIMGERLYNIYGNCFPVLIKFIDAADDLSIQVHPDNDHAPDGRGKTELWYILKTDNGAYIYSGFNRPMTRGLLSKALTQGTVVNTLAKHFSAPGDVYYLPAGRIHSIGAGNLLLEIQQASTTTYRLHDYNRTDVNGHPRQLHVEKAMDVIDYSATDYGLARPQLLLDRETYIKHTPYFTVTGVQIMDSMRLHVGNLDSPRILIAVAGAGEVTDDRGNIVKIKKGHTVLACASTPWVDIKATAVPLRIISVLINPVFSDNATDTSV